MDPLVLRVIAGMVLAALGAVGTPAWADSPEPEVHWPHAQTPEVSWEGGWDRTLEAHLSRWDEQEEDRGEAEAAQRRRVREAHLLETLLTRHGEEASAAQLREARQRLAALQRELGRIDRETAMLEALAEDAGLPVADRLAAVQRLVEIKLSSHTANPFEDRRRLLRAGELAEALLAEAEGEDREQARHVAREAWRGLFAESRGAHDLVRMDHAVAKVGLMDMPERPRWELEARWLGELGLHEMAEARLAAIRQTLEPEAAAKLDDELGWTAVPVPMARPQFRQQMEGDGRRLWRRFVERPQELEPAAVAELVRGSAQTQALHEVEPGRFEAVWIRLVRHLGENESLREAVVAELARDAAGASTPGQGQEREARVMAEVRADPWSTRAHEALLAEGERLLRQGQVERARRMFDDVLSLTPAPAARASAERGQAMVEAARGEGHRAAAAEAGLPHLSDEAGGGRPAEPALLKLPHAPLWPALAPYEAGSDFASRVPHLPDGRWWLHADERGVLAAGPLLVAGYEPGAAEPTWVHRPMGEAPPAPDASQEPEGWTGAAATPGRFEPAVDQTRVIVPWAGGAEDGAPRHLLALDRKRGKVLWSTAGDAAWAERQPAGNPVLSEGRVYVMAAQPATYASFELFCLDAQSGRTLWRRPLMDQSRQLAAAAGAGEQSGPDVASYGGTLLAHEGSLYCMPNVGTIMRVDARDGLVEWARSYNRYGGDDAWHITMLRRSGGLALVDGRLIAAPRDRASLLALDPTSGRLMWETPGVGGDHLLARQGATLVLAGVRDLRGVDRETGRVRWHRLFDRLDDVTVDATGALVAAVPGRLLRLSGDDGTTLGQRELEAPSHLTSLVAQPGEGVLALTREPEGVWVGSDAHGASADGQTWRHPHPTARLLQPGPGDAHPDHLFAYSALLLERLDPDAPRGVRWQRWLQQPPAAVHLHADNLILQHDDQLTVIDRETGRQVWQAAAPYDNHELVVSDDLMIASTQHPYWYAHMTGLDPRTGRTRWFLNLRSYPGEALRNLRPAARLIEGDRVHVVGSAEWPHDKKRVALMVSYRADDGAIAHAAPLLPEGVSHARPMHQVDDILFFSHDARQGEPIHAVRIDGGERHLLGSRRIEGLDGDRPFTGGPSFHRIDAAPNWIELRQSAWGGRHPDARWHLRRDDLAMPRTTWTHGRMAGDTLFELDKDRAARRLHVFDMTADPAAQQTIDLPETEAYLPRHILSVTVHDRRAFVVSTAQDHESWNPEKQQWEPSATPQRLRLDVIDLADGQMRASALLPDIDWHDEVAVRWVGPWLYVAGEHAIHRFHVDEQANGRAVSSPEADQPAATRR